MTPEEYDIVVRIFSQACQLPQDEQDAWLAEACRDCPHLREEVQAMLAQDGGERTVIVFADRCRIGISAAVLPIYAKGSPSRGSTRKSSALAPSKA